MKIEINVSRKQKDGGYRHLFATAERSITSIDELEKVLPVIREKFTSPEYNVSISVQSELGHRFSNFETESDKDIVQAIVESLYPNMKQPKPLTKKEAQIRDKLMRKLELDVFNLWKNVSGGFVEVNYLSTDDKVIKVELKYGVQDGEENSVYTDVKKISRKTLDWIQDDEEE